MGTNLVSIIIPVKNGEEFLDEVLTTVLAQKTDFSYEVIVIDSGSKDSSLEIIKKHNVKLFEIPPSEFNHGLTRNLGVEKSEGEYIAFITQDATPVNEDWLSNLINPFLDNPEIAGVFGKHIARENCDPIVSINLDNHFDNNISPVRKFWQKDEGYESNKGVYVFFSNNNSCIRRSIWEKIPFRKLDMSEDQNWAQDILEAGLVKCYEPSAVVYHSHTYSAIEWFQRNFDEYCAYKKIGLVEKVSLKHSIKAVSALSISDTRNIMQSSQLSILNKYSWTYKRILNNFGIVFGQFLGVRYDKIPNFIIKNFLSAQAKKIGEKK